MTAPLPLADLRILALTQLGAGPYAMQVLGDLGAEIVKIEDPTTGGDEARAVPPAIAGDSLYYQSFNRNTRGLTLDLRTAAGRALFRRLAAVADAVYANPRGDLPAKLGLDYASLKDVNPRLVCCTLTGFGRSGPRAADPAYDYLIQGLAGFMHLTGEPDGPPVRSGLVLADMVTGFYAANAILLALRDKEVNGGGGQFIDLALFDSTVSVMANKAIEYFLTGEAPFRLGNKVAGSVPAQIFTCSDGDLNVQASSDPDFRRLCAVLGLPDLADDARFAKRGDRSIHVETLAPMLEERFLTRTVAEWYEALVEADVIVAPIYTLDQTFADPQALHRGLKTTAPHPTSGEVTFLTNPLRLRGEALTDYRAPPTLGQDTEAVLRDDLGYDAAKIARLRDTGVL